MENQESQSVKKWHENTWVIGLLAIATLTGLPGFTSTYYETSIIPNRMSKLENEYNKLVSENKKLNQKISYLTSETTLAKLKKEYQELEAKFNSNQELLKSQKGQINEITNSRNQLIQEKAQLEQSLNGWKGWRDKVNNDLNFCQKQSNILNEINKLREKIEYNNQKINAVGYYAPTPIQIETYRIDNQNLNNQILEYQTKLQIVE